MNKKLHWSSKYSATKEVHGNDIQSESVDGVDSSKNEMADYSVSALTIYGPGAADNDDYYQVHERTPPIPEGGQ